MEGNEIAGILLFSYHKELNETKRQMILRALETIFDRFPDLTLNYLTSATIRQCADDGGVYHTSGFRRLIYERAYDSLDVILKRFGLSFVLSKS